MTSCVVIGGGFSGLSLGYFLSKNGFKPIILEKENSLGGLAGGFEVAPNVWVEKFYHHWFSSDEEIIGLVKELGCEKSILSVNSKTGFFYAKSVYKMSSPLDLLRFRLLSLPARIRLGIFTLYCRTISDFSSLEKLTAIEWVNRLCGSEVTEKIWIPLLKAKFGKYHQDISAVWLWNKIKLRGSSRDNYQRELLFYFQGGFQALANEMAEKIVQMGGTVKLNCSVEKILFSNFSNSKRVEFVQNSSGERIECDYLFLTVPLPEIIRLLPDTFSEKYTWDIPFLANRCLILVLDKSLSETYWLNVADPTFPFVGVIEHTNLDNPAKYGGRRIAYLSRYMPVDDPLYTLNSEDYLDYCLEFVKRIFPRFEKSWVINYYDWKADFAQPIVTVDYRKRIPPLRLEGSNIFISTMAQIYPEDRGTNYAVKYSKKVFNLFLKAFSSTRFY
ncbi:MAG: NAD(P)/FAD-dependent oxidoreductase [Deltaproteobacteria bacterium]|nr:NAD(P)/FAD-dependent oxidoreductase [Deltaproteobacteria bacterium]